MIFTLRFICGHEEKVSIKGETKKEREEKANWKQKELCSKCKEKK